MIQQLLANYQEMHHIQCHMNHNSILRVSNFYIITIVLAKIAAMIPYNSDGKKKFFKVDHVLKPKKKPDPLEEE